MKTKILYERALITCLIMLFICIILKLFGADWFSLDTNVPLLQKADSIIMSSEIGSFIVTFLFKTINGVLICCVVTKDFTKIMRHVYLIMIAAIVSMVCSHLQIPEVVTFVLDTIALYIVCAVLGYRSVKEYLLVFLLNIMYQITSLYIRSLGMELQYYGFIENNLLSIDYYIMLTVSYFYLKKGDKTLCGEITHFGSFLVTKLWKKPSTNSHQSLESKRG